MADSGDRPKAGSSVAGCNLVMLEEQIECDVIFNIKTKDRPTVSQGAHKYVLISRSEVFRKMLCGSFKEGASKVVEITDVDVDIFKEMLRYVYSDNASITFTNAYQLILTAKMYFLTGLVTKASQELEKVTTVSNVCTILNWAIFFELEELQTKCLDYISGNTKEVFNSADFVNLSQESLGQVLKKDDIKLETESHIVESCVVWAQFQFPPQSKQGKTLSLRKSLGPGFFNIRFHSMAPFELTKTYDQVIILQNKEKLLFFSHASGQDQKPEIEKLGFNIAPRRCRTWASWTRFQKVVYSPENWRCTGVPDTINFRVDKPIEFHGVHVFGGYHAGEIHTLKVRVFDGMSKNWSAFSCGSIHSSGTVFPVPFLLDFPVSLLPERTHKIEVILEGPKTFYGEEGQRTRKCAKIQFSFISPATKNRTTVSKGQIPRIIFKPI